MRALPALLSILLVTACAPPDADTDVEDAATDATAADAVDLADFAGTWQTTTTLEGVADPVPSTMSGGADGAGWTMSLDGRDNIPLTVAVAGDSLVSESAQYESILRPGVMVTVRTAGTLQPDGSMAGNMTATYNTPEGEQKVNGTFRSTRMQ
jgi:hypothetical protein